MAGQAYRAMGKIIMSSIDVVQRGRRVLGQGALLFSGFLTSQIASFVRNALLGHLLSKGDFGIAATIAITLQLLEIISDVAVDRMILQAKDGDDAKLINNAHLLLILRGFVIGALLWSSAPLIAMFFNLYEALWAFQLLALVPVIKGFMHLDIRRMQRSLIHGPFALVEALPQLIALSLVVPFINIFGGYEAVVFLGLSQAVTAVFVSHYLAERPYGIAFDKTYMRRFVNFGWPILMSALPLIAVYQGDRIVIGRTLGMEALAVYSAAFMLAMVPGLLTSKVCLSLVLPLLSDVRERGEEFLVRFGMMVQGVVITACAYLLFFAFLGGYGLGLAFGPNYSEYGPVLILLVTMWGFRIIQSAPGTGLMALGVTKPLLIAGIIRALALLPILYFSGRGITLELVAFFGVLGEFLSFVYMCFVIERVLPGSGVQLLKPSVLYFVFIAGLLIVGAHACDDEPLWTLIAQLIVGAGILAGLALYFFRPITDEVLKLVRG